MKDLLIIEVKNVNESKYNWFINLNNENELQCSNCMKTIDIKYYYCNLCDKVFLSNCRITIVLLVVKKQILFINISMITLINYIKRNFI